MPDCRKFCRLDFYSSFITDFGIVGLIELYPGTIFSLKHEGMSDEQSSVFENIDEAIRFYRFEAMETIMRFLDRYFSDVDVVPLSPSTIRKYHNLISTVLNQAAKEGIILIMPQNEP